MLKGKYLAGILASYLLLFVIGFYVSLSFWMHFAFMGALLFLLFVSICVKKFRILKEKRRILIFLLASLLLFASFGYSRWYIKANLTSAERYADENIHAVTATVEEIRYEKAYASSYVLKTVSIDDEPYEVGAVWNMPLDGGLSVGDLIEFESTVEEISGEYAYYQRSRGLLLSLTSETFELLDSEPRKPTVLETVRVWIAKNFETHIGGKEAGYATALLIGEKDALDGQTHLAYQRLGISHVLAVSGMHFSVIVGGFDLLLRVLTVPRRKKNIVLLLFSIVFAGICGFGASILRALIMFCIYYIADSIGEKSDSLTSLMFASVCIVSANPVAVYDAGLWLSVFSTLGIVLIVPSMNRILSAKKEEALPLHFLKKLLRVLLCMVMMNFTALFFTMPVVYLLYGGVSLISPLANLIFIPLTEFILYLLIALTIFGALPVIAPFLGTVCRFLIALADETALFLSDIRGIYLSIRYPFAIWILLFLIAGVLFVLFVGEFRVRRMFAVFLSCLAVFGICFCVYTGMGADTTELYIQTDGKSDMLGVIDDGEVMLIDITTGGAAVPMLASDTLADYYRCEIDTYLVTHLHDHHAGTLKRLSNQIKIHTILLPEAETEKDHEYIAKIKEALHGASELVFYKRDGNATATVGDTVISLPAYETISRSTHPIVTVSAHTDGIGAFIYCGASAMEFAKHREDVRVYRTVIFGTNGPVVKNIFDATCLRNTELIVLTSPETAALLELEVLRGKANMVHDQYQICFEH